MNSGATLERGMKNPYSQTAFRQKSREETALEYAPLVKQVANRLAARLPDNLLVDDLIQAGMIGLLDAIEKYDPTREAQFRTYAEFRIRGAMLDDLRATDWVPRSVRETADRVGHAHQVLQSELGRAPDEGEIAAYLGLSLIDYQALLVKSRTISLLSLEDLGAHDEDGDHHNVYDVLEDAKHPTPQEQLELSAVHARLKEAIAALPEKEQLVLSLYYDDDLNLKEIGAVLGITESRASQIRTQAIMRLRQAVQDAGGTPEMADQIFRRHAI